VAAIKKHAFLTQLIAVGRGQLSTPAQLAAARLDARRLGIGWVLMWRWGGRILPTIRYLHETGFRFGYKADGVKVYRPSPVPAGRPPSVPAGRPPSVPAGRPPSVPAEHAHRSR
jgi:hypothetical protein